MLILMGLSLVILMPLLVLKPGWEAYREGHNKRG
jgi:hypothetical protein